MINLIGIQNWSSKDTSVQLGQRQESNDFWDKRDPDTSLTKLLLQMMLVLTVPQVCVPQLSQVLLALETRHLIQEHSKVFKSSFLSLKSEFCLPHQFFKACIKVIEICCLKKRWRTCSSSQHHWPQQKGTSSTSKKALPNFRKWWIWELNTNMCPKVASTVRKYIFKCDEAKSFLCF